MRKLLLLLLFSSVSYCQSYPGSFTRVGLNAEGMALGNAMSADLSRNVYTFYNPALASFQSGSDVMASVALLSLDRQLNSLVYTQSLKPTAGFSLGILNATVSNIDGRDYDGAHTSDLSTSENLFFFGFSNKFSEALSLGLNFKFYYYSLYSGVSSKSIGFDIGGLFRATDALSIGLVATDIGESYHWSSTSIYGSVDGSDFITRFPNVIRLAASYQLPLLGSVLSAEYDFAPTPLDGLKAGIEVSPIDILAIRAGIQSTNEALVGTEITYSFGFGAKIAFLDFSPQVNYAYVIEPFTPYGIQTLSLDFGF